MGRDVLDLREIDQSRVALAGGKGANLGELSRIDGIRVPAGFCVTTDAFARVVANAPSLGDWIDQLSRAQPDDRTTIGALSAEIRRIIEGIAILDDLAAAIVDALVQHGEHAAYAVRSSATAEDLPTASFAGQQDTYLNVIGPAAILAHVGRCWASLFTERAVVYRQRHGIGHRAVRMAVVVQRMVFPRASGVLFTADPVTGNRKVTVLEATLGLGEALVSGLVNADVFKVRDGVVVAKDIAAKRLAIHAVPSGGTRQAAIETERQTLPALMDEQAIGLAALGRRVEAHFGHPQDIEWCLSDDEFLIVQSRPITTLFPIPAANDGKNHVYVSVGHQQMMTDAMKPLAISIRQLTAGPPMPEAGGRLFVDVARGLASPVSRAGLLAIMERGDPLIADALRTILDRGDFIKLTQDEAPGGRWAAPGGPPIEPDPAIVPQLIARSEASVATLQRDIHGLSGPALLDVIQTDFQELKRVLFDPQNHQAIMAGMGATWWLNDHLREWLGETNVADTLTLSAPGNITSEMGLALLDVADAIRPHPELVSFLEQAAIDDFLDELPKLTGGRKARDAIQTWLDRYGMRGPGEIDITKPRWSERPAMLLPIILGNVKNFAPGEAERRFARGQREAAEKEREVLKRLRALPEGERKADQTKRMIDQVRAFIGYREYPKYSFITRYFIYKQTLIEEAARLTKEGALREPEDIFSLTLPELQEIAGGKPVDDRLIDERKEAFKHYQTLTPPRVLTSEGETIAGSYRRDDVPAGALVGLPVSAGTVEGRARIVLDMAKADLEPRDILVTVFTDPSWTPLFVAAAGLVTEVGGLMTHGAVIAREYGLPAVVGVEQATTRIRNGQRIRVHGRDGYVELLPD